MNESQLSMSATSLLLGPQTGSPRTVPACKGSQTRVLLSPVCSNKTGGVDFKLLWTKLLVQFQYTDCRLARSKGNPMAPDRESKYVVLCLNYCSKVRKTIKGRVFQSEPQYRDPCCSHLWTLSMYPSYTMREMGAPRNWSDS